MGAATTLTGMERYQRLCHEGEPDRHPGFLEDEVDGERPVFLLFHQDALSFKIAIFTMEQCYSGGFLDNLSAPNRVIATACRWDQVSWACDSEGNWDEFVYWWTAAVRGAKPDGVAVSAGGADGKVSLREAFTYAQTNDSTAETQQFAETLLCWKHSGFSVDNSVRLDGGDHRARQALAQYIARAPLSLQKLTYDQPGGKVLYHTDYNPYFKHNTTLWNTADFIAALTQFVPPWGVRPVHYYGLYSSRRQARPNLSHVA